MSRIGKTPITLPKGVEIKVAQNGAISIKGPKGQIEMQLPNGLHLKVDGQVVLIERDEKIFPKSALHGLYRSLVNNNVQGVFEGFEKKLTLIGVGYRANVVGQNLDLSLGYSHPTGLEIPAGIEVTVVKGTSISIKGINKKDVGQFAADIRAKRPPEPYKGKGIRYENERVRKKEGKAAKGKA